MNDDEFDAVQDNDSEPPVDFSAKKRRTVILLLVYSAIVGILSCFLPEEDTPLDFIVGLPWLILGISWCFTDAAERDHRIGLFMRLLLILVFILGLPTYLFQTRGFGAFKALALTMVLVAAMCGCLIAAAYVTLYAGDATGLWETTY
jgi:lysylphosphatidylglycerol synthetase-like protein (DUF2156 family)